MGQGDEPWGRSGAVSWAMLQGSLHASVGKRVWFLDDYKNYHAGHKRGGRSSSGTECNFLFDYHTWDECESSYDADGVANDKPFSYLPMISWRGHKGLAGAAWLFPPN